MPLQCRWQINKQKFKLAFFFFFFFDGSWIRGFRSTLSPLFLFFRGGGVMVTLYCLRTSCVGVLLWYCCCWSKPCVSALNCVCLRERREKRMRRGLNGEDGNVAVDVQYVMPQLLLICIKIFRFVWQFTTMVFGIIEYNLSFLIRMKNTFMSLPQYISTENMHDHCVHVRLGRCYRYY